MMLVSLHNEHGLMLVIALVLSLWGGLVRYLIDITTKGIKWTLIDLFYQLIISVFTGLMGWMYSNSNSYNISSTFIVICISSTFGKALLKLIWIKIKNLIDSS